MLLKRIVAVMFLLAIFTSQAGYYRGHHGRL
jgi:hypothetical protein